MASALFPPRRTTPWWPYLPATWARAAEELFRRAGLSGRMIPVPSQIAAGCGLAWKALPQERDALCTALDTAAVGHSGRALCRLRYCHPPRRTLCAPSARSPRHGAAGRGTVQLLRVQLGGRGGHSHPGGKGTGTEQIGKRHPRPGMPFPYSCRPRSVTTAETRMSCVSCGISGHKSLSRHSSSASPVYRARNRS